MRYANSVTAIFCVLALGGCASGTPVTAKESRAAAKTDASKPAPENTITTVPVADGVFMLVGRGGNIGLSVGDDAAFLIDDQYAPMTVEIEKAVAAVSDQKIEFVLNTHWHFDHTGGNENFGNSGAVIVAHHNVRKRMSVEQVMPAFNRTVPASPPAALPVISFDDGVVFHLNGDTIQAIHIANAHTDGDALVYFAEKNVLHMGDTYFHTLYPFIDTGSGGSINGMIMAAEKALALSNADTKIIPGHGPLASRDDLRAYRDMLATVRDGIAALIKEGKSKDEVVAMKPTAQYDATFNANGFLTPDQWVSGIFADLSK